MTVYATKAMDAAMQAADGHYSDGRCARAVPVRVRRDGAVLLIEGEGVALSHLLSSVRLDARLARVRRSLWLPGGSRVLFEDSPLLDALVPPSRGQRIVAALERHWGAALVAVLVVALGGLGFFRHGLPVLAERVAMRVPPALEREAGVQVLSMLDRLYLYPTGLELARQSELREAFVGLTAELERRGDYRLVFRRFGTPNAFALPGGDVVLTDELVALAGDDDEILAVLAHEVGHQEHRHGMRMVLQDSAMLLVFASMTGDVSSLGAVTSGLPTLLVRNGYSREFEREADAYALALMRERGIPPQAFADIMRRFADLGPDVDGVLNYISTHPATTDRINAAEAASNP